uniref:Reverse transcriptase domain-containing protein n=1 Tax=Trichogramma kaykai TaxID=54128 RepID=A0ABD2VYM0_9HYME
MGPILWNVMYDAILRLNYDGDVRIIGFADDIAVVAVAKHLLQIEHNLNAAILQYTLVPLHPLPGPAHRRQAEVRPPPPNSQHNGSQCDRCPYEDHAQLWRAQKRTTQAVCSRHRLHTLVWSPHLEHGSSKASLNSPGRVSPPTSLPACDRRLRILRPPPRERRERGTLGNAKQVAGSMGPVDEGPMDASTDPKHQGVDREEARRAELPPHAAFDRARLLQTPQPTLRLQPKRAMPGLRLIHRECGALVLSLPEVQRRKRATTLSAPQGHDAGKYHQAHACERAELARERAELTRGCFLRLLSRKKTERRRNRQKMMTGRCG